MEKKIRGTKGNFTAHQKSDVDIDPNNVEQRLNSSKMSNIVKHVSDVSPTVESHSTGEPQCEKLNTFDGFTGSSQSQLKLSSLLSIIKKERSLNTSRSQISSFKTDLVEVSLISEERASSSVSEANHKSNAKEYTENQLKRVQSKKEFPLISKDGSSEDLDTTNSSKDIRVKNCENIEKKDNISILISKSEFPSCSVTVDCVKSENLESNKMLLSMSKQCVNNNLSICKSLALDLTNKLSMKFFNNNRANSECFKDINSVIGKKTEIEDSEREFFNNIHNQDSYESAKNFVGTYKRKSFITVSDDCSLSFDDTNVLKLENIDSLREDDSVSFNRGSQNEISESKHILPLASQVKNGKDHLVSKLPIKQEGGTKPKIVNEVRAHTINPTKVDEIKTESSFLNKDIGSAHIDSNDIKSTSKILKIKKLPCVGLEKESIFQTNKAKVCDIKSPTKACVTKKVTLIRRKWDNVVDHQKSLNGKYPAKITEIKNKFPFAVKNEIESNNVEDQVESYNEKSSTRTNGNGCPTKIVEIEQTLPLVSKEQKLENTCLDKGSVHMGNKLASVRDVKCPKDIEIKSELKLATKERDVQNRILKDHFKTVSFPCLTENKSSKMEFLLLSFKTEDKVTESFEGGICTDAPIKENKAEGTEYCPLISEDPGVAKYQIENFKDNSRVELENHKATTSIEGFSKRADIKSSINDELNCVNVKFSTSLQNRSDSSLKSNEFDSKVGLRTEGKVVTTIEEEEFGVVNIASQMNKNIIESDSYSIRFKNGGLIKEEKFINNNELDTLSRVSSIDNQINKVVNQDKYVASISKEALRKVEDNKSNSLLMESEAQLTDNVKMRDDKNVLQKVDAISSKLESCSSTLEKDISEVSLASSVNENRENEFNKLKLDLEDQNDSDMESSFNYSDFFVIDEADDKFFKEVCNLEKEVENIGDKRTNYSKIEKLSSKSSTIYNANINKNKVIDSKLDENIGIPGLSFIIGIKLDEKSKKANYDCVLCSYGKKAVIMSGYEMKSHVKTRPHLMNVLMVQNYPLYEQYKKDKGISTASFLNIILEFEATIARQMIVVASEQNYLQKRKGLENRIKEQKQAIGDNSESKGNVVVPDIVQSSTSAPIVENSQIMMPPLVSIPIPSKQKVGSQIFKEESLIPPEILMPPPLSIPILSKSKKVVKMDKLKKSATTDDKNAVSVPRKTFQHQIMLPPPKVILPFTQQLPPAVVPVVFPAEVQYIDVNVQELSTVKPAKILKYDRVAIVADIRYTSLLRPFKKMAEVIILADKELKLDNLEDALIKNPKHYSIKKNMLYLVVTGIHSITKTVSANSCQVSACKFPLQALNPVDEAKYCGDSEKFVKFCCENLVYTINKIRSSLPSKSDIAILPPLPVSLISTGVTHKKLHEKKLMFPDYMIANRKASIGSLYTNWMDAILALARLSLSKFEGRSLPLLSTLDDHRKLKEMDCSGTDKPSYKLWQDVVCTVVETALSRRSSESMGIFSDSTEPWETTIRKLSQTKESKEFEAQLNMKIAYDYLVYIGHASSLELLPEFNLCGVSLWDFEDIVESKNLFIQMGTLNKMAIKKVLFIILSDVRMIGTKERNPECLVKKCWQPLTNIHAQMKKHMSNNKMKNSVHSPIDTIVSEIKKFCIFESRVVVAPFTPKFYIFVPNMNAEIKYHTQMHDFAKVHNCTCFLKGSTKIMWENALKAFELEWGKLALEIPQETEEHINYVKNIFSKLATQNYKPVTWKNVPGDSLYVNYDSLDDWRLCIKELIMKSWVQPALPDIEILTEDNLVIKAPPLFPISQTSSLQSSILKVRTDLIPSELDQLLETSNTNPLEENGNMPPRSILPDFRALTLSGSSEDNEVVRTIINRDHNEVIQFAKSILNARRTVRRRESSSTLFNSVFIVKHINQQITSKELDNPFSESNFKSKMIFHNFAKYDDNDLKSLLIKLRDYPAKSLCCLVFDLSIISTKLVVSSGCANHGCNPVLLVNALDNSLNSSSSFSSQALNKLDHLIEKQLKTIESFIHQLHKHISVIILPLSPTKIFCDDDQLNHEVCHSISNLGSYIVQGSRALWKRIIRLLIPAWNSIMEKNNSEYDFYNYILTYTALKSNAFIIFDNVSDSLAHWTEPFIWKAFIETFLLSLVQKKTSEKGLDKRKWSDKITVILTEILPTIPSEFFEELFKTLYATASIEKRIDKLIVKEITFARANLLVKKVKEFRVGDSIFNAVLPSAYDCIESQLSFMEDLYITSIFEKVYEKWRPQIINILIKEINEVPDITTLKTTPCTKELKCGGAQSCIYYHNLCDKRRNPLSIPYRSQICIHCKQQDGSCPNGDQCLQSHNIFEQNFHPINFQIKGCLSNALSEVCCNQELCKYAHKGSPEMFFTPDWKDLLVIGGHNTLNFFTGAIRSSKKLDEKFNNRILLISPSSELLNVAVEISKELIKTFSLQISTLGKDLAKPGKCDVLIGEPNAFVDLDIDILRSMKGAVIIDDVQRILRNAKQAEYLHKLIKLVRRSSTDIDPNIVVVCARSENYSANELVATLSKNLNLKLQNHSAETDLSKASSTSQPIIGKHPSLAPSSSKRKNVFRSRSRSHEKKLRPSKSRSNHNVIHSSSSDSSDSSISGMMSSRGQSRSASAEKKGVKSKSSNRSRRSHSSSRTCKRRRSRSKSGSRNKSKANSTSRKQRSRSSDRSKRARSKSLDRNRKARPTTSKNLTTFDNKRPRSRSPYSELFNESDSRSLHNVSVGGSGTILQAELDNNQPSQPSYPKVKDYNHGNLSYPQNIDGIEASGSYMQYYDGTVTTPSYPQQYEKNLETTSYPLHYNEVRPTASYPQHFDENMATPCYPQHNDDYRVTPSYPLQYEENSVTLSYPQHYDENMGALSYPKPNKEDDTASHTSSLDIQSNIKERLGSKLYEEYVEVLKNQRQLFEKEFSVYRNVPELCPYYQRYYEMFTTMYAVQHGVKSDEHKDRLWTLYWKSKFDEIKNEDWQLRQQSLLDKFERKVSFNYTSSNQSHAHLNSLKPNPDTLHSRREKFDQNIGHLSLPVSGRQDEFKDNSKRHFIPVVPEDLDVGINKHSKSVCQNFENSSSNKDGGSTYEFKEALSVLEKLCASLGFLGPALNAMVVTCRDLGTNTKKAYEVFTVSENVMVVNMVIEKIKALKLTSPGNIRLLYERAIEYIPKLLEEAKRGQMPESIYDRTAPIDIVAIARVSMGKSADFTINLVKTALEYEGLADPHEELVSDLYRKVCQIHFKLSSDD